MEINESVARKVLEVVDAGLVTGIGNPSPGQMCVEAAVCYALGLPHGDNPECVSPALRSLKIKLNDSSWSSKAARARGLRRLAIAQLGSRDILDEKEFVRRIVDYAIRVSAPKALRIAASAHKDPAHRTALLAAANKCQVEGTRESVECACACAVSAAAYAAPAIFACSAARASTRSSAAHAAASSAAAYAYAYAHADDDATASYADDAIDRSLAEYAEDVVKILVDMNAPGCRWLTLTGD